MELQFLEAEKRVNNMLVFSSFNLTVKSGQVVAIYTDVNIKNKLIEILTGKAQLSNGEIRYDGDKIDCRQHIGFMFIEPSLYGRLTVEEMLNFTKRLYSSMISLSEVLEKVQLDHKKRVKINKLTYSEKKRVQLACLIIQDREVLILDEPDQNLDVESRRVYLSIIEQLRKSSKVVLVLTSNMESALTAADQVFKLNEHELTEVHIDSEISNKGKVEETNQITFDKIPSKVNDKIVLFHPPEIDYIESIDGQTYLFVRGESFPCNLTLQKLEDRLIPFGFFRCHRSYIVNLQKVREVITWTRNSYSLVLENKEKSSIPLSKAKMAELKDMMGL